MSLRILVAMLMLTAAVPATGLSYPSPPPHPQEDGQLEILPVATACAQLTEFLQAHPDNENARRMLGCVHAVAYARGCSHVIAWRSTNLEKPLGVNAEWPTILAAARPAQVDATRTQHLAEAIHAFSVLSERTPEDGDSSLQLATALSEAHDHFTDFAWPFETSALDQLAKVQGREPAFWEGQAMDELRRLMAMPEKGAAPNGVGYFLQNAAKLLEDVCARSGEPTAKDAAERKQIHFAAEARREYERQFWQPVRIVGRQPREIEKRYPITPEALETADLYARAYDAALPWVSVFENLPVIGNQGGDVNAPLTPERLKEAQAFVAGHEETWRLLEVAAQRETCRYPVDVSDSGHSSFAHLNVLRRLGRMLALRIFVSMQTQDSEGIVRAIRAQAGIAQSLRNEPTYCSMAQRASVLGNMTWSLEWAMNHGDLSPAALEELQHLTMEFDAADDPKANLDASFLGMDSTEWQSVRRRLTRALRAFPEGRYTDLVSAGQLAFGDEATADIAAGRFSPAGGLMRRVYLFCGSVARLRVSTVALAVHRYQLEHHALPTSLDVLVPAYLSQVPEDPFNGKPLRFTSDASGFVVYSVGRDLKDDAGTLDNGGNRDVSMHVHSRP